MYSYTTVMDACGKTGQWAQALEVLEGMMMMMADDDEEEEVRGGGRPNLRTFTVAMKACAK